MALLSPGCGGYARSCPGLPSRCAAKAAWRLRALLVAATRVAGRMHRGASLQVAANHLYNESPTSPAPNVGLPPRSSRPRRYAANVGLLPRSSRSRDAPRPKGRNRDAHPARSAQSPWGRTLRWPHSKARVAAAEWGRRNQKKIAQRQPSAPPRRPCRLRSSADAEPFAGWPLTPGCGGYARSCPGLPSRCAAKAAWRLRAHLVAAIRVTGRMHRGCIPTSRFKSPI